jgi:hypothetical protein
MTSLLRFFPQRYERHCNIVIFIFPCLFWDKFLILFLFYISKCIYIWFGFNCLLFESTFLQGSCDWRRHRWNTLYSNISYFFSGWRGYNFNFFLVSIFRISFHVLIVALNTGVLARSYIVTNFYISIFNVFKVIWNCLI